MQLLLVTSHRTEVSSQNPLYPQLQTPSALTLCLTEDQTPPWDHWLCRLSLGIVTVTGEQNPKPRERQAMAVRQLWHYPTKKRCFLMSVTALEKLVYARTSKTPHHSQRERILKAVLLISTSIFISKRFKKPGILSQQTPTKTFINHFPVF